MPEKPTTESDGRAGEYPGPIHITVGGAPPLPTDGVLEISVTADDDDGGFLLAVSDGRAVASLHLTTAKAVELASVLHPDGVKVVDCTSCGHAAPKLTAHSLGSWVGHCCWHKYRQKPQY